MASSTGFEPVTPSLGNLCSIQLSYEDVDTIFSIRSRMRFSQGAQSQTSQFSTDLAIC